jgi:arsenate reductase
MTTVIFACVHNAGRSQMAAAFFNQLADPTRARALSAGTQPATAIHPEVVAAMREVGLDLRDATPRMLTDTLAHTAELLVTMGCGETCPVIPGLRRIDWTFPDPKGQPLQEVRTIRDAIRHAVEHLVDDNHWRAAPPH